MASIDVDAGRRDHYRYLAEEQLFPRFGDVPVDEISEDTVRAWGLEGGPQGRVRVEAHCLFSEIMNRAKSEGLIADSPCRFLVGVDDIDLYLRVSDDFAPSSEGRRVSATPPVVETVESLEGGGFQIRLAPPDDL